MQEPIDIANLKLNESAKFGENCQQDVLTDKTEADKQRSSSFKYTEVINSIDDLYAFLNQEDVMVVGFFSNESNLKVIFSEVAKSLEGKIHFGFTLNQEILKEEGYQDAVVLYRPKYLWNVYEPDHLKFEGVATIDNLKKFIEMNKHGLVGHRKKHNTNDFPTPRVIAYIDVDYIRNVNDTNYWRTYVLMIAQRFVNDFTFAFCSKEGFRQELISLGYDDLTSGPVILAQDSNEQVFILKDEFSLETFQNFLLFVLKGSKLAPYIPSYCIKKVYKVDEKPVKVSIFSDINEIVSKNTEDTIIKFVSSCENSGNCENLVPGEDLGEKMKDGVAVEETSSKSQLLPVNAEASLDEVPEYSKKLLLDYQMNNKTVEEVLKNIVMDKDVYPIILKDIAGASEDNAYLLVEFLPGILKCMPFINTVFLDAVNEGLGTNVNEFSVEVFTKKLLEHVLFFAGYTEKDVSLVKGSTMVLKCRKAIYMGNITLAFGKVAEYPWLKQIACSTQTNLARRFWAYRNSCEQFPLLGWPHVVW